jgi:hypothetical protein
MQYAFFHDQVRWLLGEAALNSCSNDSDVPSPEMPLPQGRLEITAALRRWMSEVT